MNEQVKEYVDNYPVKIGNMFYELREIVFESISRVPEEKMWAKLPSYYVGERFVRLIPFKDHINIEAEQIVYNKDKLGGYKITPRGMLQIYLNQDIPYDMLVKIFSETLIH